MTSGANRKVSPERLESDAMNADCLGRNLFELITGKWTLLVLWSLDGAPLRFFEVRDQVEGISERVLSEVLKRLCRAGPVSRHVDPSVPPKVRYALTDSGRRLLRAMCGLTDWIANELDEVEAAKRRYDAEAAR